jgi:hypothetical protein
MLLPGRRWLHAAWQSGHGHTRCGTRKQQGNTCMYCMAHVVVGSDTTAGRQSPTNIRGNDRRASHTPGLHTAVCSTINPTTVVTHRSKSLAQGCTATWCLPCCCGNLTHRVVAPQDWFVLACTLLQPAHRRRDRLRQEAACVHMARVNTAQTHTA